jgi:hypothetical protein
MVISLHSMPGGVQSIVRIECVGRIENIEASKALPLTEVWVRLKPPIHDLSTTLSPSLEGNILGYSLCNLVFKSYVRGASKLNLYDNWILHSLSQTPMLV